MNIRFPTFMKLPWRADAAEFWFSHIKHLSWAMLLHSGLADHRYSRFDIIVADPITTLTTIGSNTILVSKGKIRYSLSDPLALLDEMLQESGLVAQRHPNLPFLGGAVGLFGYDLGRRFEVLPSSAVNDISIPDMAVGIYDWAIIIDHQLKVITLISYNDLHARIAWIKSQHPIILDDFYLTSSWNSNMCQKEYISKFRQVKKYLQNGDCYQINLAQRFQATYFGDEWQAFCRLNASNKAPFSAFLRLEQGVILSLSPERFIRLIDGMIQTRPIKGTLPRLSDINADKNQANKLANSIKDQTENLMIVDLMRNDIGKVAIPGSVQVPELFMVELFPTVYHLVSTITAKILPLSSACDLLRSVFPGGSITGVPKVRAMEIIEELEPHRRNAWCGSIGYLSACGSMDTNITIRTLIACNGNIYCSAGSGIIVDSDVYDEYQETLDKINLILQQLAH